MDMATETVGIDTLINPRLSNAFGDVIRRRRMKLNLTQDQVGTMVGLDFWAIKQFERGLQTPTPATRHAIAVALGLDEDALRRLPIESTQTPATTRRPDAARLFGTEAPPADQAGGMRTFVLVLSSHGETMLMRDLNEAATAIDQAPSAVIHATETITHDGEWFTTTVRYRAFVNLFPDAACDLPDPTAFVEPDWVPGF